MIIRYAIDVRKRLNLYNRTNPRQKNNVGQVKNFSYNKHQTSYRGHITVKIVVGTNPRQLTNIVQIKFNTSYVRIF